MLRSRDAEQRERDRDRCPLDSEANNDERVQGTDLLLVGVAQKFSLQ